MTPDCATSCSAMGGHAIARVCLVLGTAFTPALASDAPLVEIIGGTDASGQNYTWTVTNRHRSPIISLAIPHYRAALFVAPPGWSADCTYLVNVGVEDRPGVCTITPLASGGSGLANGRSAEFRMQIAASGAGRGRGRVSVRFADGTSVEIDGVETPQPLAAMDRYAPVLGLGGIALLALLIGLFRNRRKSAASPSPSEGA